MTVIDRSSAAIDIILNSGITRYGHAVVIGLCGSSLSASGLGIAAKDVAIDCGTGYGHAVAVGLCRSDLSARGHGHAAIDIRPGSGIIRYGHVVAVGLCGNGLIASGRSIATIDAIGCGTIGYGHAVVIGLCGGVFTVRRILVLAFTLIVQCTYTDFV